MPRAAKTERLKEMRTCHLHGDVLHVQTIHHRRADGSAAYQWRCMTCRNETSRTYQYNRRRELKADTRDNVRPLAPLVAGAERPASQTLPVSAEAQAALDHWSDHKNAPEYQPVGGEE